MLLCVAHGDWSNSIPWQNLVHERPDRRTLITPPDRNNPAAGDELARVVESVALSSAVGGELFGDADLV